MPASIPPLVPVYSAAVKEALRLAREGNMDLLEQKLDALSDRDLAAFEKAIASTS